MMEKGDRHMGYDKKAAFDSQYAIYTSIKQVPLELRVVLAEDTRDIGELIALGIGSVLEFKGASVKGDAVLYAEEHPFAEGNVIRANDHYGIKIAHILEENPLTSS